MIPHTVKKKTNRRSSDRDKEHYAVFKTRKCDRGKFRHKMIKTFIRPIISVRLIYVIHTPSNVRIP
jgi:hypothetical protein